jgi:hypothetical protein
MIWLTWRQFRVQAAVAACALAVLAVVFGVTGPALAHLYATSHSANYFLAQVDAGGSYKTLYLLGIGVLFLAPAIIGAFWGAPMITRELEAGTFRLAWNQSVTRTRWLAVKVGLLGLASMATAGLLSLMLGWWAGPIDRAAGAIGASAVPGGALSPRLSPVLFAASGITPVGYAAFAFALGVTVGVLIRRTVPAMAITLAVFAAVQIAMPIWIRPHLITPLRATSVFNPADLTQFTQSENGSGGSLTVADAVHIPGAWVLSNQTITPAGHVFTGPATPVCQQSNVGMQQCADSLVPLHLRQVVAYQPASRYWPLQWYETGIFLALAVALAGLCYWRIRRRLS